MSASPQASLCAHCRGPLPPGAGTLTCPFCGATNVVQTPLGTSQVRAIVRRVLDEERAPRTGQPTDAPPPDARRTVVLAAAFTALALGAIFVGLVLVRHQEPVVIRPPGATPVVPRPPPPPPPPPVVPPRPSGLGAPSSLTLTAEAVYLTSHSALIRAHRTTLREQWRAPLETGAEGTIVAVGDHVVWVGPPGAFFFDAGTGKRVGQYLFRHGGFKATACASTDRQVMVKTVFDGVMHFDVRTGQRAAWGPQCPLPGEPRCDVGQRCGWWHGRVGEQECRYTLGVGGGMVTFCEEDGTKELAVVRVQGKKTLWRTKRGPGAATNPDYASVVDGVLVVSEGDFVEAFDVATGKPLWSTRRGGSAAAVVGERGRLWLGDGETVVVRDVHTGEVVERYETPAAN